MSHDLKAGLEFLRWLYPEGPWVLTAINVEQTATPTRTFAPGGEAQLERWLTDHAQWNIYYHVNKVKKELSKKAERSDIAQMCFLHVDIDPRVADPGADLDEHLMREKNRIKELLSSKLPLGVPLPSALVDSGGGINALWRLQVPVQIDGDEARYEEAKRYNLQLEILLGGDNCHNVDRILRLPGSINWPNEKKRKKGRKPTRASSLRLDASSYTIDTFVAAPLQQAGKGSRALGGSVRVEVSGNVKRLDHVDALGDKVSNRTKMLIVQGQDPDDPGKWPSRSELLYHVVCELVRAGLDNDTIYSVITDPGFLISASVLDKGSSVERYALRQIQQAREAAIAPELPTLNERFAVIGNMGGKCRIVEEVIDHALNRAQLTTQSFEDFRNRFMHERVQTGRHPKTNDPVYTPLGQWWLQNPNRRQFETLVFVPGREIPGAYNLWKGFTCDARDGSKHLSFLAHLHDNICNGNEEHYDYLLNWMARAVQQPDTPGEVAVVFRGKMGVGKSFVPREFGKLWGQHAIMVSDPKHLVGSFNLHLRDAVIVFADEAFYAGDKKHESILKTLITSDTLQIEGKGKDVITGRNYVHLIMASNSQWVIPAGPEERRYFVLDVGDRQMQRHEYFAAIERDMSTGGRENLLYFLLRRDISRYEVRKVPQTQGLQDQKLHSLTSVQEWWYSKLCDGELLPRHVGWQAPVFKKDLLDDYLAYAGKLRVFRPETATSLGRFMGQVLPEGWPKHRQHKRVYHNGDGIRMEERAHAYLMPPLEVCRAVWDERMGGPYRWSDDGEATAQEIGAGVF